MYLIRTQEHNDTRLWQHWPAEEFYVVYRMEKKTLFEDDLYLGANAQKYRQSPFARGQLLATFSAK